MLYACQFSLKPLQIFTIMVEIAVFLVYHTRAKKICIKESRPRWEGLRMKNFLAVSYCRQAVNYFRFLTIDIYRLIKVSLNYSFGTINTRQIFTYLQRKTFFSQASTHSQTSMNTRVCQKKNKKILINPIMAYLYDKRYQNFFWEFRSFHC